MENLIILVSTIFFLTIILFIYREIILYKNNLTTKYKMFRKTSGTIQYAIFTRDKKWKFASKKEIQTLKQLLII